MAKRTKGKPSVMPPAIMQLIPSMDGGGAEQSTLEMASALAHTRPHFVVTKGGRMTTALTQTGAKLLRHPIGHKSPWGIWRNARWLARMVQRHNIALIHARSRAPAWVAWLVARRLGVPYVTTYHGRPPAPWRFWKCWYNSALVRGRLVIAASHWTMARLQRAHRADKRHIRLIPRGVAIEAFAHPPALAKLRALRKTWGVQKGELVLLLPARITHAKGHGFLLKLLAQLTSDYALRLVFVGAPKHKNMSRRLALQAQRLGVADQLCFAGHSHDMPLVYAAADIVVVPSLAPEPFGRAVIEAQAAGRLVLASRAGGMAETLIAGTGYALAPGDTAQWLAALRQVLDMPAPARQTIARAARAHVRQHYTLAHMQAATLAVYDEVLS